MSTSTASRVLNRQVCAIAISERTRERVVQAAQELSYVPSGAARALSKGKSRTLGVLGASPSFFFPQSSSGGFTSEAMRGLVGAAIELRYHLTLLTGEEASCEGAGVFADIGLADGLLVLNRDLHAQTPYVASLAACPIPIVYVLDYPNRAGTCAVAPDDAQGGRLATERLIQAGHRRIAFVRREYFAQIFDRRQRGWEQAMQAAGLGPDPAWAFRNPECDAAALRAQGLTAAVCAGESTAKAFCRGLAAAGVSVPDDFHVIAFSHEMPGAEEPHEFAAVVQPLAHVVEEAVRRLVRLVEGQECEPPVKLFDHAFRPGRSFAPRAGGAA